MKNALIAIIVAFIGYSVLNISQAGQKIGLETADKNKRRGIVIWIIATLGTSVAAFILLYAVSLGSVALVGAMAGTGLASLAVFSRFVMKERFGYREISGVFTVIVAAVLIGGFTEEYVLKKINTGILTELLVLVTVLYIAVIIIVRKRKKYAGILIGGFSGALGGFIPMFQKVAISDIGRRAYFFTVSAGAAHTGNGTGLTGSGTEAAGFGVSTGLFHRLIEVFANQYAVVWILLSIVSVIVVQFAYKKDQAIRIIPAFSINYILIPVIGGIFVFKEELHPLQWIGVIMIMIGMLLITIKPSQEHVKK